MGECVINLARGCEEWDTCNVGIGGKETDTVGLGWKLRGKVWVGWDRQIGVHRIMQSRYYIKQ